MGRIGKEIIQAKIWIDPTAEPAPEPRLNYKDIYPKTVFDAVYMTMDDNSETLASIIGKIETSLSNKQKMLPAKPANYLVTYGGTAGNTGAIRISNNIPYDSDEQSTDAIPTEKAVGDLLKKFGIINEDGTGTLSGNKTILWKDIIGRPSIYNELGNNQNGVISQKGLTEIITDINNNINIMNDNFTNITDENKSNIDDHINNTNNPHNITPGQINAVSLDNFNEHVNTSNPHGLTKADIDLGNVDNTSDKDKPVSDATQVEIDKLTKLIRSLTNTVDGSKYIVDIEYDQVLGRLNAIYNDDTKVGVSIITDGLLDEVKLDPDTHILKFTELNGKVINIDLSGAFKDFYSHEGSHINVNVENGVINATIVDNSITSDQIAINGIETESYADQSIVNDKIQNSTIEGIKLADNTITSDKIEYHGLSNDAIGDRSVNGRTLFTSLEDNKVLTVTKGNTDPRWTLVSGDMIDSRSISTRHLVDNSIIGEKIADNSILGKNIKDNEITGDKITDNTIKGESLVEDAKFSGTPELSVNPELNSDNQQITTTSWVRELLRNSIFDTNNIIDRSVNGAKLFSSHIPNRALIVTEMNADAHWDQINHETLADDSVSTNNIIDKSITSEKIKDRGIDSNNLNINSVTTNSITDSAVTSEKIYPSEELNRVLGVVTADGHPKYTKVIQAMMDNGSVGTNQLENESITLNKLKHSEVPESVLAVTLKDHDPQWMKVQNQMIEDRAITSDKLWLADRSNMVLGVIHENTPAVYLKVNGKMIEDKAINGNHIIDQSITTAHLAIGSIGKYQIADNSIFSNHLTEDCITGRELFKSNIKHSVLVTKDELDKPVWSKITSEMLENNSITSDKLFTSNYDHRVIGVKEVGDKPEYLKITGEFIEDGTIGSDALKHNLILYGHPILNTHPKDNSNDYTIADTEWVNNKIRDKIVDLAGSTISMDLSNIDDHAIRGNKLFTSNKAPAVIGIDTPNGNAKYMTINNELIDNDSISSNKLKSNIELYGSPTIEVRPSPQASDEFNLGNQLPDCQWVLDRITDKKKEFYQELKEEICCLRTPDPDAIVDKIYSVGSLSEDEINNILAGNYNLDLPGDSVISNDIILGPITTNVVGLLLDNKIDPTLQRSIFINRSEISSLTNNDINAILNGNYLLIARDPLEFGYGEGITYCNSCGTDKRYSYITRISDNVINGLADGYLFPGMSFPVEVDHEIIYPINDQIIEDIVNGDLVITEPCESLDHNGHLIAPLSADEIIELLTTDKFGLKTVGVDITEYPEEQTIKIGADLIDNSVVTSYIQDRAVTGEKLFTSHFDNRVLVVTDNNTDPKWGKVTHDMIEDYVIDVELISSSDQNNRIIGVENAGDSPKWMQINHDMLLDNIIDNNNLIDNSVTESKISDKSVTASKLYPESMINTVHLIDRSVDVNKLAPNSVDTDKIIDNTITSEKLARDIILPGYTNIEETTNYETRCIRNTIISVNAPIDSYNGDIWFKIE